MALNFERVDEIGTEVWEAAKDYYYEISAYETEDLVKTNNEMAYCDSDYSLLNREEYEENHKDEEDATPKGFVAALNFHQGFLDIFTEETQEWEVYAAFITGYEPELDVTEEEIAGSWRAEALKTAISNWKAVQKKAKPEAAIAKAEGDAR